MIAWHYTVGSRAEVIRRDGLIRAAIAGVPGGERPVVWFSTREDWEPTATKGIIVNRVRRDATMQEMLAEGGVWRFGVPSAELIPWGRLKETARIRPKMLRGLLQVAQEVSADPYDWYGSLEPVAVDRCVIQCRMTEADAWGTAK